MGNVKIFMGGIGFFAGLNFIQRCSRPFPAVRQEWGGVGVGGRGETATHSGSKGAGMMALARDKPLGTETSGRELNEARRTRGWRT